jgi:hypothetical protein
LVSKDKKMKGGDKGKGGNRDRESKPMNPVTTNQPIDESGKDAGEFPQGKQNQGG